MSKKFIKNVRIHANVLYATIIDYYDAMFLSTTNIEKREVMYNIIIY